MVSRKQLFVLSNAISTGCLKKNFLLPLAALVQSSKEEENFVGTILISKYIFWSVGMRGSEPGSTNPTTATATMVGGSKAYGGTNEMLLYF